MGWFVLVIGLVALATGAVMVGGAMNARQNSDGDTQGYPTDGGDEEPRRGQSPDIPLNNAPWTRAAYPVRSPSGLDKWRWEPAGLQRPALPSTVVPDTTVSLQGPRVTVPIKLPRPWIVGSALPLSPPTPWLSSWSAAVSQSGDLFLWPWQAGMDGLPDRFAILIPAHKLARLRSNPQDPRVALSSLVILDLRLGLPRKQIKARQIPQRHAGATGASSPLSQAGVEPDERGLQRLTQTLHDLHQWSGGVPVLAGVPAGSSLPQDLDVLAGVGFDGAVIFASPLASGLPLPASGGEVGLPLGRALAAARTTPGNARTANWPIIVTGSFATPADCLKALALGATAVILDVALACPELLATQVEPQETQEPVQMDEGLVDAATKWLTGFDRELASMLRLLGCRRLAELSPQLLIDHSAPPAAVKPPDPGPVDVTPASLTGGSQGAVASGPASKRVFIRPRPLVPHPLERIRVLSER